MIKTFLYIFNAGKKGLKPNYDWQNKTQELKSLKDQIETSGKTGLVHESTTKEEFSLRFKHLSYARIMILVALVFSITRFFCTQPLFGHLCALLASGYFTILLTQYSYRSWCCLYIWRNWEKRKSINKPRFGKFVSDSLANPLTLFQCKLK